MRLPSLTYFLIKTLLCSFDDLILKCFVKISEMITVTGHTNDQITVFIRVILCIDQSLPVYDIELDMMSVQIKVRANQICHLFQPVFACHNGRCKFLVQKCSSR